jgi:DNA-binding NarL/FixJ family response regulator
MSIRGRSLPDPPSRSRPRPERARPGAAGGRGSRIRIGVVDDHEVVRRGLRASLELEPDMEIVGDVRTGREAIRLADEEHPDIMLVDVRLEDTDGPTVCERLREVAPATAVVMLSSHHQHGMVLRSLAAGARGYVVKDVEIGELKRMIRAAHRGESVLDPVVAPGVIAAATADGNGRNRTKVKHSLALSDIDIEIVRHLSHGLTNKEIGVLVHRSPHTVKDHVAKISAALEVRSRTEIVAAALRIGLI